MRTYNILKSFILILCFSLSLISCNDSEDTSILKNDCLKRTLGPNLVGQKIEFAYAMAVPYHSGKILSAEVEASIAGASGTWLENNSYYTSISGVDVPVLVGSPSVTNGAKTKVDFTVDTCAATLRYYYVIPEEARGKTVSFTFTAKASTGETVSYKMGPYTIAQMAMAKNLTLTKANCYISIGDMSIMNADSAAKYPDKVDLVYIFRDYTAKGITFGHAFCAPATDSQYLPEITLPGGVNRDCKIRKEYGLDDNHLSGLQYGIYIDDIDFTSLDLSSMPDYAINMKARGGLWVETQDGKYRAFIYVNSLKSTSGGVIGMKRYTLK